MGSGKIEDVTETDQRLTPSEAKRKDIEGRASRSLASIGLAAVLVAALLSSISHAMADCPPYTPDPSLLENLEQLIRGLPGAPPLTLEQKKHLKELAQEKSPDRLAELAKLQASWRFTQPAPLPNPSSGPAPLTVEIVWPNYPVPNPLKIEFDVDGDRKPEWIEETYQVSAPRRHIYQREGEYEFTVRIVDRSGQVHSYRNRIRVFTPAAFDAELQRRWSGLKEALRQGDISAALECIHTHSRDRYNGVFQVTAKNLTQKVDEILTNISVVKHRGGEAIYESVQTDKGLTKSFEVRFGIDVDGVWRITSF